MVNTMCPIEITSSEIGIQTTEVIVVIESKTIGNITLGDDSILSVLESNVSEEANLGAVGNRTYQVPALYEKMLQTAAVAPEKFKGIEYLMKTIAEDGIIPEDFQKLYQTFKKAVKLNG